MLKTSFSLYLIIQEIILLKNYHIGGGGEGGSGRYIIGIVVASCLFGDALGEPSNPNSLRGNKLTTLKSQQENV